MVHPILEDDVGDMPGDMESGAGNRGRGAQINSDGAFIRKSVWNGSPSTFLHEGLAFGEDDIRDIERPHSGGRKKETGKEADKSIQHILAAGRLNEMGCKG